ncbi:MAG: UDP-glucose 4-epimerase GalE [Bdellovibrionales bacterium]|nr:UDP-glucose 4-epimerase GalE [Bdellovibrionales bacterium]
MSFLGFRVDFPKALESFGSGTLSSGKVVTTQMRKVLVIGGAGYIGSHTHYALIERGVEVLVYDNLSTGFRELIHPQAQFIEGCMSDEDRLTTLLHQHKVDGVIHFAASIQVEESTRLPLDYYWNNTSGLLSVLKSLRNARLKVPFIFSSTAAVYGEPSSGLVSETQTLAPINPYGRSKLFSEQVLKDHGFATGLPYMILRYFNVAGARADGSIGQRTRNATHLIKLACEVALRKRPELLVFGSDYPTFDGTGVRDYIHVEDLAEAHICALEHLWRGGQSSTYNCGYGRGASVLEVLRAFEKILGRPLPFKLTARRAGDPASLVADSSRIRNELGWAPKREALEGICRSALEWESCSI